MNDPCMRVFYLWRDQDLTGSSLGPGTLLNIALAPYGGMHLSIATAEPVTLPRPKPTLLELTASAKEKIHTLKDSHAKTMALHALVEAELWAAEAKK